MYSKDTATAVELVCFLYYVNTVITVYSLNLNGRKCRMNKSSGIRVYEVAGPQNKPNDICMFWDLHGSTNQWLLIVWKALQRYLNHFSNNTTYFISLFKKYLRYEYIGKTFNFCVVSIGSSFCLKQKPHFSLYLPFANSSPVKVRKMLNDKC